MARYIALLRGINISGKNKISMPELKTALGEKGFADVKTYLNSGNVFFFFYSSQPLQTSHQPVASDTSSSSEGVSFTEVNEFPPAG